MLKANPIPISFYKEASLEKKEFFEYKKLRLQVTDEESMAKSKFVVGAYWRGEYVFAMPVLKKAFIKKVRNKVATSGGEVTFHGDDYVHCSVPIGEKLYWATITYQKKRYLVKMVEASNKKLLSLESNERDYKYDKEGEVVAFHKMIPVVLGYRIDAEKSIYKRFVQKKIYTKTLKGEYWFIRFKKHSEGLSISHHDLLTNFKNELKGVGGKELNTTESSVVFQVDKTVGEFRVSADMFTIKILDESEFDPSLPLNLKKDNIRLYGLQFNSGQASLKESSESTLVKIEKLLKDSSDLVIEIQGHTDSQGDEKKNLVLSTARANAVKEALIKRGIQAERLKVKGFGERNPIADNKTQVGREANRRVELKKISGGVLEVNIELFKPLAGYEKSVKDFKKGTISDKKSFKVTGKEVRGHYKLVAIKNSFSKFEVMKNYEHIVHKLGGKVVSKTSDKLFFILNQKVSGRLSIYDKYYYISLIYTRKGEK